MKIIHIFAAAAALGLASCSNDGPELTNNFPKDKIIRVTTNVNNVEASRTTSDYTGSNFALYISPKDTENSFTYKNIWFTKSGSEWESAAGTKLSWQSSSTNYEYYAYAPASGTSGIALTDDLLPFDLSTDNFDLLWTHGSGLASELASSGALDLVFDHMFCQFFIEVEIGSEYYLSKIGNPVGYVTYTSALGKGKFNIKTGKITNDDASGVEVMAKIGPYEAGSIAESGKYTTGESYLAPGEQSIYVSLLVDGVAYAYTHPAYTFEAGKSYTLKIRVGNSSDSSDSNASSLNAIGITVKAWSDGNSSDIYTN